MVLCLSVCVFASDYAVKEKPLLGEDMKGGPDYIVLRTLDTDSIRIIGSVLGQSIALDYFVSQVRNVRYNVNILIKKKKCKHFKKRWRHLVRCLLLHNQHFGAFYLYYQAELPAQAFKSNACHHAM